MRRRADTFAASAPTISETSIVETLIDIRDDLTAIRNLVTATYMACHALNRGSSERSALCEVTNGAREKLDAVLSCVDALIAQANASADDARR